MTSDYIRRTKQARHALECYLDVCDRNVDEMKTDIIDLVSDLFHLAHKEGIDYASIIFCAREHFLAETQERAENARKHGRRIKGDDGDWFDYVRDQYIHDSKLPD